MLKPQRLCIRGLTPEGWTRRSTTTALVAGGTLSVGALTMDQGKETQKLAR